MLRKFYDWILKRSSSRRAELWLALVAVVPADILFVPMALATPRRAYRYALIATLASTAGGIAGYYLGHFAYNEIAKPILALYGRLDVFEQLRASTSRDAILPMLITSFLAYFPPIEIVTILSGVVGIDIWLFVITCVLARGVRFFTLAWAFTKYGEPIRNFIERRLGLVAGAAGSLGGPLLFF